MSAAAFNGNDILKLVIVGDMNVGKTCLLYRYLENSYQMNCPRQPTMGVEFGCKAIELGTKKYKLQIWDTAGQERFRSVTRTFFRNAMGCVLVYDITKRQSFENVTSWLLDARQLCEDNVVVMLVGSKCDLEVNREVSQIEAAEFAKINNVMFIESSALKGTNVDELFLSLAKAVVEAPAGREKYPDYITPIHAAPGNPPTVVSGCC